MNPDGSYSYGYELSDGSFTYVNADGTGSVFGGFGYRTATGQDINIQYTSGVEGYRPSGAGLPELPQVPGGESDRIIVDENYT